MIVADTSAMLAIAFNELECVPFLDIIKRVDKAFVSTVSVTETRMVLYGRRGHQSVVMLDRFLQQPCFEIVAPGPAESDAAYDAFVAYGKGSGHPAGLNFGDLFSYALAKTRDLPLLFKGNDFSHTDIRNACDVFG